MEKIGLFIKSKAFIYIAVLAGSVSMLFIGQEIQIGLFAWITTIFLLQFSRRAKPIHFLLLFGLLIVVGFLNQKTHNLFNDLVFGLINGVIFSLVHLVIYIVDRVIYTRGKGFMFTLVFPLVYVVTEVLITSALGTSGVLALSQFSFTPLAQLSTITGIHGITFLICWLAAIVYWVSENDFKRSFVKKGFYIFGTSFVVILAFGFARMMMQTETKESLKVATVSGPFDLQQLAKNERDVLVQLSTNSKTKIPSSFFSNDKDISTQISNTRKAAEAGAKIIVWNEAALFLNDKQVTKVISEVIDISKTHKAYILLAFFEENNSNNPKPINNKSVLITKDGAIGWEYKKVHLAPAEVPLVNPGKPEIPTYTTEYGKIGSVICYDYDFPSFLQQAYKIDADIMLVPAYDWKGFAPLHSKMAQFEALQSGRVLIRANGNDGINLISDNKGQIISELKTYDSEDRILYARLPLNSISTFYSKSVNLFAYVCILSFVLLGVIKISTVLGNIKNRN